MTILNKVRHQSICEISATCSSCGQRKNIKEFSEQYCKECEIGFDTSVIGKIITYSELEKYLLEREHLADDEMSFVKAWPSFTRKEIFNIYLKECKENGKRIVPEDMKWKIKIDFGREDGI